jgi:hypothetical protein
MKTNAQLPNPFIFLNQEQVQSKENWPLRRKELLGQILELEYGPLPPRPEWTRGEVLYSHFLEKIHGARNWFVRLLTGPYPAYEFYIELLTPNGTGPFPMVISGDACWRYLNDDIQMETIQRGYGLCTFNRVTLVPDDYRMERDQGLYLKCQDKDFGALSAWAWGYHRVVDYLVSLPEVDPERIAVTGHSRGGKTALLAGATDERIALTAPNNSGCGGAGCFRWQGEGAEKLKDILSLAPNWFSPNLKAYIGKEDQMPFDQHSLKACVAPRGLLSTEALGDLWANPSGSWITFQAAREVYRFLGVEAHCGIWYREGGHDQGIEDWRALLDFADLHFFGKEAGRSFDSNPFPDLPAGYSWNAP